MRKGSPAAKWPRVTAPDTRVKAEQALVCREAGLSTARKGLAVQCKEFDCSSVVMRN